MKPRLLLALVFLGFPSAALAFERTEDRRPCDEYIENRKPLFGDLHIHTSYSFDAYVSSVRATPWDAYRYAQGEAIEIPAADGEGLLTIQILGIG